MKAYKGSEGIAPLILNLGTRWTSVASLITSRERPMYPFNRSQSECYREEKHPSLLPGFKTHIIHPTGWDNVGYIIPAPHLHTQIIQKFKNRRFKQMHY